MLGNIFKKGAFTYDPNMTPQQLSDKRAMLAMLQPKYGKASYIGEGLGQLATGVATGIRTRKLDEIEGKGREQGANLFSGLFGNATQSTSGQSGPMNILGVDPGYAAPPSEGAAVADDTMRALNKTPMRPYRDAIAGIESAGSGDYAAIGPTHPKMGRAVGRYQVMEANIGPWSKAALGREVSTDEFLNNPQIQDAVFDHIFGGYLDQYGPEGAAQAWFAGPGGVGKTDRKDVLGTTVGDYGKMFTANLGGPVAAPAGASAATNSALPNVDMNALMTALANPWLSPEERANLTTIFDHMVQAGDPLRQIEVAKSIAELEKMNAPPAPPEELLTRMALLDAAGVDRNSPEGQNFILTGKMPGVSDPASYGTTLQFWTDADGKTKAGVIGNDGSLKEVAPPGGGDWALGIEKIDLGTGYQIRDKRTGEVIGFEPKDIAGAEKEKVLGEAEGKAEASAEADISAAEDALTYIDSLRNHPGRLAGTGGSSWTGWIPGTDSKEFQIEVERLKSGAFLTAIQQLRGMGSLSNAEGQTATAAVAALATEGTEEGFMKRLEEYENIIQRGMDRARGRIKADDDAPVSGAAPAAGGGTTRKRYNPATGAFE